MESVDLIEMIEGGNPENCFACGPKNEHGLHLHFSETSNGALAQFVPSVDHEGWPGVVHGGILLTVLDEAMAYALFYRQIPAFTARLETRFRRTAAPGTTLIVTSEITAERLGIVDARSAIALEDGTEIASATGRFVPLAKAL
jgi:acyl-coenzyme A thioesterase PaaI-like protein